MSDTVNTTLRKNALGVGAIVFLVLAAVAPLTGMVVVASLAIAFGNGGGAPFSFLAVAARARVDVVEYHDDSEALMPEADKPVRVTRITLRPRITVCGDVADARLRHLVEVAHRECYIANSVSSEIVIEPEFRRAAPAT